MPIEIIKKQKTEPNTLGHFPPLVPLKCCKVEPTRARNSRSYTISDYGDVGDTMIVMPGTKAGYGKMLFNVTKTMLLPDEISEAFTFVRDYEIKSIIIHNDNDPAPVL